MAASSTAMKLTDVPVRAGSDVVVTIAGLLVEGLSARGKQQS